jgi:hypothetical protein
MQSAKNQEIAMTPAVEPAGVSEVTPALLRNCAVCLENGMTPATVAKELRAYADILASSDLAARQQLAELDASYRCEVDTRTSYAQQLAEMRGALATERARIDDLHAALVKYGWHDIKTCDATNTNGARFIDEKCTCGFDAALAPTSQPSRGSDEPECPGEDCRMCNGEACNKCGAGCWNNAVTDCEHDGAERHEEPDCAQPERQGAEFDRNVPDDIKSQPNFYRDLAREMTARADRVSLFLDAFAELVATGQSVMVPDEQIPESGLFTITAKARHVREFNHAMRKALKADVPPRPSPPPTDDIVAGLRNILALTQDGEITREYIERAISDKERRDIMARFLIIKLQVLRDHLLGGACDQEKAAKTVDEAIAALSERGK